MFKPVVSLLCAGLLSGFLANADPVDLSNECESLDRPNIDCGCVAGRLSAFQAAAPSDEAADIIVQGYLAEIGKPHDMESAAEAAMSDGMAMLKIQQAFEPLGGRPENITEYEKGCVIADAEPIQFETVQAGSPAGQYASLCESRTGDARYCQCEASQVSQSLSPDEIRAYTASFSDYSDDDARSLEELSQMRAENLGLSTAEYSSRLSEARSKLDKRQDAQRAYCSAAVWADNEEGSSSEDRSRLGFEPGALEAVQSVSASAIDNEASGPAVKAESVLTAGCSAQGYDGPVCQCVVDEFRADVVPRFDRDDTALAWALLHSGSHLPMVEYAQMLQSVDQRDHEAAGMVWADTMDTGAQCYEAAEEAEAPAPLKGTPRARMEAICIAENEDEALCDCMVEKMEASFPPDDFELFVDIREAEFQGAEDAFAQVAEDRGLTRAEAKQALENNPALISGSMAMGASLMQCMGGMPAMPNIPGMPPRD